jgi:hypothetical protein
MLSRTNGAQIVAPRKVRDCRTSQNRNEINYLRSRWQEWREYTSPMISVH